MNFRTRIRQWLGINEIQEDQSILHQRSIDILSRLNTLHGQIIAANRGMSRLVAKLDPEYSRSDFDPQRRRESDELSTQIIRKLIAEHTASQRPEGSK
jgi:hypothetical protein